MILKLEIKWSSVRKKGISYSSHANKLYSEKTKMGKEEKVDIGFSR